MFLKSLETDNCYGNIDSHISCFTTTSIEETFLQDLQKNSEEMCPRYYMHSDIFSEFNSVLFATKEFK